MSEYVGAALEYTHIDDKDLSMLDHAYTLLMRRQLGGHAVSREEAIDSPIENSSRETRGSELHDRLVDSMADYFYKALGLPTEQARRLVLDMEQHDIIPDVEQCRRSPLMAIEHMRLATFTGIVPIMMHMQESEQFEQWLPDALRVVLPPAQGHSEKCINGGEVCESDVCPARALVDAALVATYDPDYGEYSYEVNDERTFDNLRLLLASLYHDGLIDELTWRRLDDDCVMRFSSSRLDHEA